jgi:hypothetical protein
MQCRYIVFTRGRHICQSVLYKSGIYGFKLLLPSNFCELKRGKKALAAARAGGARSPSAPCLASRRGSIVHSGPGPPGGRALPFLGRGRSRGKVGRDLRARRGEGGGRTPCLFSGAARPEVRPYPGLFVFVAAAFTAEVVHQVDEGKKLGTRRARPSREQELVRGGRAPGKDLPCPIRLSCRRLHRRGCSSGR